MSRNSSGNRHSGGSGLGANTRLVILDRDGTLNADSDEFIKSPEEWWPLPGALDAVARLNHAGWQVVVASNQSGLGRGLFDISALNAIHTKMHRALAAVGGRVDAVFYCPHAPEEACTCRKPLPGLFEQIGERFRVDLAQVPCVGDSLRDVVAGAAAGCEPHLVATGKGERFRSRLALAPADPWAQDPPADLPPGTRLHADLAGFVAWLLDASRRPGA